MRLSIIKGSTFGVTSGIITTLGLIVGLHSGTNSRIAVIGGIVTIAVADAFSDALGIHISEESENVHTDKEVWVSTICTFLSKFLFAIQFIIPILLFKSLKAAIIASVIWGFFLLGLLSYYIARTSKSKPLGVIAEHLFIGLVVIIVTHYLGILVGILFN